ncbi:serine/threonine kinase [Aureococcus anophagefferens]|nr:serine/threonine kinase [Aureococcus anophagefferens]
MASDSESECDLGDEPSNFLDLIFGLPPSRDEFYDVAPSWCGEAQLCATPTDAWAEFLGGMPWHGWVRGRATLEGGRLRWFENGRRQPVYEVEVEVGATREPRGRDDPARAGAGPGASRSTAPRAEARREAVANARLAGVARGYEFGSAVGRGSGGVVYVVRDRRAGRVLAGKIMKHGSSGERRRAAREARICARIMKEASDRCVCANVCRVERVFELAGRGARVVLLMELCEGGDLLSRLQARGGRLGAAEGARAISMIARGLRALHEGGILHLDLKPENCLYEAAAGAALKITDFGLAKHRDDDPAEERAPPRIVGTLGYMAPEIVLQRPATPAADVSLGTVAFLLLSGTQAIALHGLSQREKLVRTLQCLVDFRPEAWAGVSPDAKAPPAPRRRAAARALERGRRHRAAPPEALAKPPAPAPRRGPFGSGALSGFLLGLGRRWTGAPSEFSSDGGSTSASGDAHGDIAEALRCYDEARIFTSDQLGRLRTVFEGLSRTGDGRLGLEEFARFARLARAPFAPALMFSFLDLDLDGFCSVDDYHDWVGRHRRTAPLSLAARGARTATDLFLPVVDGLATLRATTWTARRSARRWRRSASSSPSSTRTTALRPESGARRRVLRLEPEARDAALDGRRIFPAHVAATFANLLGVHLDGRVAAGALARLAGATERAVADRGVSLRAWLDCAFVDGTVSRDVHVLAGPIFEELKTHTGKLVAPPPLGCASARKPRSAMSSSGPRTRSTGRWSKAAFFKAARPRSRRACRPEAGRQKTACGK